MEQKFIIVHIRYHLKCATYLEDHYAHYASSDLQYNRQLICFVQTILVFQLIKHETYLHNILSSDKAEYVASVTNREAHLEFRVKIFPFIYGTTHNTRMGVSLLENRWDSTILHDKHVTENRNKTIPKIRKHHINDKKKRLKTNTNTLEGGKM